MAGTSRFGVQYLQVQRQGTAARGRGTVGGIAAAPGSVRAKAALGTESKGSQGGHPVLHTTLSLQPSRDP